MNYTSNFQQNSPTEGNTRKVSACFLRSHVCDVIEFRDDHARMRINDPLASFARFEREKNQANLVCPANLKTAANMCGQYCDTFLEMEFRIRNSYPMDRIGCSYVASCK